MTRISTGILVSAALLAVAVPAAAHHSWGNYHWSRSGNPFTLQLGNNVSNSWKPFLDTASTDWSKSSVLDTSVVSGGTNATKGKRTPKNCVPTLGKVEVCSSKYGATGWLGIAQIWINGDHIVQGAAKMNDTYFNTATYNTPAWKRVVMCQEIAHTFGLDHQDEVFDNENLGTCMDYTNDPDGGAGGASASDLTNEHPNDHDYEQLETIYGHLDNQATSVFLTHSTGAGNALDAREGTGESDWGRAIRHDGAGRQNVFEKDLGNGGRVITHVFWAP
jgi:hypothetical protein